MFENKGLVFVIPIDQSPSVDLTERIRKTLDSCKSTIEDHYKKKTFYFFLESLISHIVTALVGTVKPNNSNEDAEKINKLEKELKLKTEVIKNSIEEYKKLKIIMEEKDIKMRATERNLDELSQKFHNLEFLHKDSENRRNSIQTDYNSIMEEVKTLRKFASEKFEFERKCKDFEKEKNEYENNMKELENENISLKESLDKTKKELSKSEKDINSLKDELRRRLNELNNFSNVGLNPDEDAKNKSKKIEELTLEIEGLKETYIVLKSEYEDYQASQELIMKKNTNDIKEIRKQYNKEKELTENLSNMKIKLENDNKELINKIESIKRSAEPVKSITPKEKTIMEALSTRIDGLTEENELYKKTINELKAKLLFFENESKMRLQLLVNYASKYTQDHLEEYKEAYLFLIQ